MYLTREEQLQKQFYQFAIELFKTWRQIQHDPAIFEQKYQNQQ